MHMTAGSTSRIIQALRRSVAQDGAPHSDGQLLESYVAQRDEEAFAALVQRHGPMVWGVCCRALSCTHDRDDAFQAIFLVLLRKAASVVPRDMVGSWLHGVACKTVLKTRAMNAKRRARETTVPDLPERPAAASRGDDLQQLLDQELSRLPAKYRAVIILCELEGKSYRQAAQQLRCPEGTVGARLSRARKLLARRLARHGLPLSAGAAAVLSPAVPAAVLSSTLTNANLHAAGPALHYSAHVLALAEGVLKTMLVAKLKTQALVLLALRMVGNLPWRRASSSWSKRFARCGQPWTSSASSRGRRVAEAGRAGRARAADVQ
jgi:RNA polymerase sigma factor (sigma-70 family)